jgi:hypothetical protein
MVIMYFAPWSLAHLVALPLVLVAFIRARLWRWGPTPGQKPARLDQALLAALYLGWFTEAVFLQKVFHYSQSPVMLIALALLAAHRWPIGPLLIGWSLLGATLNESRFTQADPARMDNAPRICRDLVTAVHLGIPATTFSGNAPLLGRAIVTAGQGVTPFLNDFSKHRPNTYQQVVPQQKLINDFWTDLWWTCLTKGSSPAIKDRLSHYKWVIHSAPTWTELDEVKQFLETLHLRNGELVCWDDTTHPLYLELNIRPAIRFMHVNTSLEFRSKRPQIRAELIDSGHKYVVSDLAVVNGCYGYFSLEPPPDRPLDLPVEFPCFCRNVYPWNQPVIAKCGRYWVHRVENPIYGIRIPYPAVFGKD